MFLGLKRQKIVRMHKTCPTSQFLKLSLACIPSQKNLANESLRNSDIRQVLCILTIFCRFKPQNICIFPKFSRFQLFQSKIILSNVVKKSLSLQSKYFFEFSVFKCEYFCV